jgi:hypothetical protein
MSECTDRYGLLIILSIYALCEKTYKNGMNFDVDRHVRTLGLSLLFASSEDGGQHSNTNKMASDVNEISSSPIPHHHGNAAQTASQYRPVQANIFL